jgi:DNA-binding CsgD family transcriptional regulator
VKVGNLPVASHLGMTKAKYPNESLDGEGWAAVTKSPAFKDLAWELLAQATGCCVVVRDVEGRFYFANTPALRLMGCTAVQLRSKRADELLPNRVADEIQAHVKRVCELNRPLEAVEMIRGKKFRAVYRPLPQIDGYPPLVVIVSRGGSERASDDGQLETVHSTHQDRGKLGHLSDREIEVLRLIGDGLTTRQIATRLSRTTKTVEAHRAALGRKLGVGNRVQLARIAIEAGICGTEQH